MMKLLYTVPRHWYSRWQESHHEITVSGSSSPTHLLVDIATGTSYGGIPHSTVGEIKPL